LLPDTQRISLLLLLDYESINNQGANKGKLLQISTGEGKSTISAMLAAILDLHGENVDLITSYSMLATTGYEGPSVVDFKLLGLRVGINIVKPGMTGQKACYSCDIL
jgi:preprotein translocase subunit SecA